MDEVEHQRGQTQRIFKKKEKKNLKKYKKTKVKKRNQGDKLVHFFA